MSDSFVDQGDAETITSDTHGKQLRRLVLVLFVLSGATGLVYEVIWIRLLSLVFGNTVYAISTVLTAFWTGLAAGAYLAGRWIDRHPNPLRVYGLLEGSIGLYSAATPALLALLTPVYITVARTWPDSSGLFLAARFLMGFTVLLIPTTCMGATLPVIARFYVRRFDKVGRGVGLLYGLNTLGAVVGCFSAGFVSIPLVGVSRTLWAAVAANLLIGALAWTLARRTALERPSPASIPVKHTLQARWLLLAFGAAGFASLVYEVAWTRVLVLIIGSTVYAYTTMLTIFILGIGLGSLILAPILDRRGHLVLWFAGLEAAIGFWALLSIPLFNALPEAFVRGYGLIGPSWLGIVGMKFAFSALVMLPATLCMGGTFPIVCRLYTERIEGLGESVGVVYSANTVGAIAGSFLTGFVAIPLLGAKWAIVLAAGLNALIACGLCLSATQPSLRTRLALAAGAVVVLLLPLSLSGSWNRHLLTGGAFHLARYYGENPSEFRQTVLGREILYYAEGPAATVTVLRSGELMSLQINGKAVASNHRHSMLNQLFLGHLPVLLHPDPRDALIIGLGSGTTAGSVSTHPVERIDIVEIAPEVPPASRFFDSVNHRVLDDPRVRLLIADGRNHLLVTEARYDVITTDPVHPWRAGSGSLFTTDYYRLARSRLKPGGLMCQWVPLYGIDAESARSIVKTFAAVFPHVTVWSNETVAAALIIGSDSPQRIDTADFARRFDRPAVKADLAKVGVESPWSLLGAYLLDERAVASYVGDAPINTDDDPFLEFKAPKSLYYRYQDSYPPIILDLLAHRTDVRPHLDSTPGPAVRAIESQVAAAGAVLEGWARTQLGQEREAEDLFELALKENADHPVAREMLSIFLVRRGVAATAEGKLPDAETLLRRSVGLHPSSQAHVALGNIHYKRQRWADAIGEYRLALELEPMYVVALKSLSYALINAGGQEAEAEGLLRQALALDPSDPEAEQIRKLIERLDAFVDAASR